MVGGFDSLMSRAAPFCLLVTVLFVSAVLAALNWRRRYSLCGVGYLVLLMFLFCDLWRMNLVIF